MSNSIDISRLQDENTILQQELNKVEDLLASARAERDEILIKYNALSDKVIFIFFTKSLNRNFPGI